MKTCEMREKVGSREKVCLVTSSKCKKRHSTSSLAGNKMLQSASLLLAITLAIAAHQASLGLCSRQQQQQQEQQQQQQQQAAQQRALDASGKVINHNHVLPLGGSLIKRKPLIELADR